MVIKILWFRDKWLIHFWLFFCELHLLNDDGYKWSFNCEMGKEDEEKCAISDCDR